MKLRSSFFFLIFIFIFFQLSASVVVTFHFYSFSYLSRNSHSSLLKSQKRFQKISTSQSERDWQQSERTNVRIPLSPTLFLSLFFFLSWHRCEIRLSTLMIKLPLRIVSRSPSRRSSSSSYFVVLDTLHRSKLVLADVASAEIDPQCLAITQLDYCTRTVYVIDLKRKVKRVTANASY